LPHVKISAWQEGPWMKSQSVWTSPQKSEIRMTIAVGSAGEADARSLTATVQRRRVPVLQGSAKGIIDLREHGICRLVAQRVSEVLERRPSTGQASIQAMAERSTNTLSRHIFRITTSFVLQ
jgi:hypothetical protein